MMSDNWLLGMQVETVDGAFLGIVTDHTPPIIPPKRWTGDGFIPQFIEPGECVVLLPDPDDALLVQLNAGLMSHFRFRAHALLLEWTGYVGWGIREVGICAREATIILVGPPRVVAFEGEIPAFLQGIGAAVSLCPS